MNTPIPDSRVYEFCLPKVDVPVQAAEADRAASICASRGTLTGWRISRLLWIKDTLPDAMRARHGQWGAESGERERPSFRCWSSDVEISVKSPLAAEAFHAMPLAEQVHFLRTWNPGTPSWDGPMREGLAAILQAEVKAQPVHFFENAGQFTGLDPVYSSALVRGFSERLAGRAVADWEPFWTFARWILAQPDPEAEIQDDFTGQAQRGRRWQSCRLELARFLDATLNGELAPLPLTERASVWQLIDALIRDPNPAPADEAREDQRGIDPFTLSLNTVRGEAVHAVFSFIRWVRSRPPNAAQGGQNLDDVPEARAALEARLDPQQEPTRTVRSVIGANLARLAFWAETWLGDHLRQVFPAQGQIELRETAWDTFIRCSRANGKTFALLRRQYFAAIARMSPDRLGEHRHHDGQVRLGQNLVENYGCGHLDFEQPGNLLAAFFARAPEQVRAEVVAFVGRSLTQSDQRIPPEILVRLLKLWNWQAQFETAPGGPGYQDRVA
jgi:hypothetical protein